MLRCLLTCAVLFALSPSAHAQDVEALYREGVQLRAVGEDEAALERFQRAYDVAPSGRILAQIGFAEQALARWSDAHRHLSEALDTGDPWVEERRGLIDESLAIVSRELASTSPATPPATPASPPRSPATTPADSTASTARDSGSGPEPFLLMGVGGAAAVVGAILVGLSAAAHASVEGAEPGTYWVDVEGAARDFETFAIAGSVLLGASVAALAGSLLWLTLGSSSSETSATVRLRLGPAYFGVEGRL